MTEEKKIYYICPKCLDMTQAPPDHKGHEGRLIAVSPGPWDDERRKPPLDAHGHVMTRAPRWYLEAIGILDDTG